jgi:hypothetical protein
MGTVVVLLKANKTVVSGDWVIFLLAERNEAFGDNYWQFRKSCFGTTHNFSM